MGSKAQQTVYLIKYGLVSNSVTSRFHPHTGAIINTLQHSYIFNPQSKLQKRSVENNPQERIEFIYNLEGNLTKVTEYDPQGSLLKTTHFYYIADALTDKYGFYPDISGAGIDSFFQVLGKFFNKLPTSWFIDHSNPGITNTFRRFEYELNSGGYPVTRKAYKNVFGLPQLEDTRTYEYAKFDTGLKLSGMDYYTCLI